LLSDRRWECQPPRSRTFAPDDERKRLVYLNRLRPVAVQDWWAGGELVPLELSGTEQNVFVRREGSGPSMTLLHGFPSSSHDWGKIAPALAEQYALTMPDLL